MKIIEKVDNNSEIIYIASAGMFMVKCRDFCNYRYEIHNKTK